MENKNRLTQKNTSIDKAGNHYMRLAEIIFELFDTYPNTVEEILKRLKQEKYIHKYEIVQVKKRLNCSTTPNSRLS